MEEEAERLRPGKPTPRAKAGVEEWGEYLLGKLADLAWLTVVVAVLYYSNLFRHIFLNPDCNRPVLEVCFLLYGVSSLILLYSVVVVCHIRGVTVPLDEYNPGLVYAATFCAVTANILLVLGIWPVFGLKALLLDFFLLKGFFTLLSFSPRGKIGEVLFIAANVCVALSGLYWQHEGYLHH